MPIERIHILGGGLAGLAAAWALTSEPHWHKRRTVTLHQAGWRLGGRCASGRNPAHAWRIEEHGPHVWMGFYDNAFAMMRGAFAELGRPQGSRIATFDDAFSAEPHGAVLRRAGGGWESWPILPGVNAGRPGETTGFSWRHLVETVLGGTADVLAGRGGGPGPDGEVAPGAGPLRPGGVAVGLAGSLLALASAPLRRDHRAERTRAAALASLRRLQRALRARGRRGAAVERAARRGWILGDLGLAILRGLVTDRLLGRPLGAFDRLDDETLLGWLRRHGASEPTLRSGPVHQVHEVCFAFRDGDPEQPDLAAGAGLRTLLRVAFTFRGALLYTMRAGMGETVVAPLYEVLARRGVQFRFFSRVDGLEVDPAGGALRAVRMQIQARGRNDRYDPLVDVDGLPCWPVRPLADQLREPLPGPAHHELDVRPARARRRRLVQGRDWDALVLALPIEVLAAIGGGLPRAAPRWEAALTVPTAATRVGQLWLDRDREGLGWRGGGPFVGGFAPPFPNWADLSHVLAEERWPGNAGPRSAAYVCGPMPDAPPDLALADGRARVRRELTSWLEQEATGLWPAATAPGGGFDWSVLHDPEGRTGPARLDAQYLRSNHRLAERQPLSVSGCNRHKLRAGDSGLAGVVVAGDWTFNGFNVSCVEGAVLSGLQAARALGCDVGGLSGEGSCAPDYAG